MATKKRQIKNLFNEKLIRIILSNKFWHKIDLDKVSAK